MVKNFIFWVQNFSHSWVVQRNVWKSECVLTGCEGVLATAVHVPCSSLSCFLLFLFRFLTLSVNHRCQMICQQTLHSPALLPELPRVYSFSVCFQLSFPPVPLCLGHNFKIVFAMGMFCQSRIFIRQNKSRI